MPIQPQPRQLPNDVLQLDWPDDAEHPIGPQGAKPKRVLISPDEVPRHYLRGGHRYLFKVPEGARARQIWAEVIAYEIAKIVEVPVPPAFLAVNTRTGSPGVLIEFFYGHVGDPPLRFYEGTDFLQAMKVDVEVRHGGLRDNIRVCRRHRVIGWRDWWGQTLAFDALIGNTDRHSQNWGFLIDHTTAEPTYSLAPAFDNGTSLGQIVRDADLARHGQPEQFAAFVDGGRHHYSWLNGQARGERFLDLCQQYIAVYGSATPAMRRVTQLHDGDIDDLMHWCTQFDFPIAFTSERAAFVSALIKARRNALAQLVGA